MNRGQSVLTVVMWATGITVSGLGLASSIITPIISSQSSALNNHESRISAIEAKIERIPNIEAKLDALLINQGINPNKVEDKTR